MIDKLHTQQILINLIQNAIKFSSHGQLIKIELTAELIENSKKVKLYLKVVDQGIGISENDLRNLFKAYSRG